MLSTPDTLRWDKGEKFRLLFHLTFAFANLIEINNLIKIEVKN